MEKANRMSKMMYTNLKILFRNGILPVLICLYLPVAAQTNARKSPWSFAFQDSINNSYKGTHYAEFDMTTLDGRRVNSAASIGKVTFLTFWFESCAGCRAETGELNVLYDSLKTYPQFQFVAVTYDDTAGLKDFLTSHDIRYPVATVYEQDELKRLNYHNGCPSFVIIDKKGFINEIGLKSISLNPQEHSYSVGEVLAKMRRLL